MFPGATRRQQEAALQSSKTFSVSRQQLDQWSRRLLDEEERATFYTFFNEYQSTRQVHIFVFRCAQLLRSPQKRYLIVPLRNVISPIDRAKFDKHVQEYGLISASTRSRDSPSSSRPNSTPLAVGRRSATPTLQDFTSSWPTSGFATSPRRRPASTNSERDKDDIRKLLIRRGSESEGLGFSIRGGAEHKVGLYVSSVAADSAAQKSGLKPGMQLLKANDVSVEAATTEQAVRILRGAKKLKLAVVDKGMYPDTYSAQTQYRWIDPAGRPVSPPPERRDADSRMSEGQPGGRSEMRLLSNSDERKVNVVVKDGQKLGISIRGGVELGVGIYVSHVTENSVAEHSGLRAGDQILDVNGESFLEITHSEAIMKLKSHDLMVMTIKDVGKIPHSTVKYDRAKWVYCNNKQNDVTLREKSATLPARLHRDAKQASQQPAYFKEQPSADFSTFKPSDDVDQKKRQSTIFKHGMGTQMVMKSTQVSTARAEVNEKAQAILTEHEFSSLDYYLSEYQEGHVSVDDLVTALMTILDTIKKASLVTEIGRLMTPRDVDRFESLVREKEMDVLRERQRLDSINRMKAAAIITDSPPIKRQAVPGSSQVDIRQSPFVQRAAGLGGNESYSPDSSHDEDEVDYGGHPLVHQVATVAVVHKASNRQQGDEDEQEESESEEEDRQHHVAADAISDISDSAVLVAVNAIAAAVDETDRRNETKEEEEEKAEEESSDETQEEEEVEAEEELREERKEETVEEARVESEEPKEEEPLEVSVTEDREVVGAENEEPAVFHVPPPPGADEDSESEEDEGEKKEEEGMPTKEEVRLPNVEVILVQTQPVKEEASPVIARRPPIFMAPPPPPEEEPDTMLSPPVFHVPPPPPENYEDSSDEEEEAATHRGHEVDETTPHQLEELERQDVVTSPDQHAVLQETMLQRRRRIHPGSVYIRDRGNRSTSVDSTATEVSVDESWDPSFQDSPILGRLSTSTPYKGTLDSTVPEQESLGKMVEVSQQFVPRQSAKEDDQGMQTAEDRRDVIVPSETGGDENVNMEENVDEDKKHENAAVPVERDVAVLVEMGHRMEAQEPQKPGLEVPQLEVEVSARKTEEYPSAVGRHEAETAPQLQEHEPQQTARTEELQPPERNPQENISETAAPVETPVSAPAKPEDIYAVPNKPRRDTSAHQPDPKPAAITVAGFSGLTGQIITVLIPKNKPRLGMSVNGGSNTKQKEVRIRDVQKTGCASAVMPPLKLGQQILSVDHRSLKGLTHRQSVELIKECFSSRRTDMELTVHEDAEVEKMANGN